MAQKTIIDIFEECIVQLNQGQSIDDCLRRYPDHASRLRPMLETVSSVHDTQVSASEMYEDQALVWQRLDAQLADNVVSFPPRRRPNIRLQLLIALLFLLLATMGTWFFMTRPDSNEDLEIKITVVASATPSPTMTASPIVSPTATATNTPSPTATATHTAIPSETATTLPLPTRTTVPAEMSATPIPSSPLVINTTGQQLEEDTSTQGTSIEDCAAPFTLIQVVALVAELYPTATITYAIEVTELDTSPIWEVETDQGLILTIDAVCGELLYVEEIDTFVPPPNPTTTIDDEWYDDEDYYDDGDWDDDGWYEDETWDDEDYYDDEWYDDETWDDEDYYDDYGDNEWYEDETWDDEDYYDDYSDDEWYEDDYDG